MSFIVSGPARADAASAIRFYNSKPERHGAAFQREFDRAVAKIERSPRLYTPVEDGVTGLEIREYFIIRFSQRVIYVIDGDDVLVVAVIHSDAREGTWHKNIPPTLLPETT